MSALAVPCFKPRVRARAVAVVATLLASGCADSIYYSSLGASPRALSPRPVETVDTFAVTPPERPHTDVVLIEVVNGLNSESVEEMVGALRVAAAGIGCDAILLTSIDHHRSKHPASVQGSCVVYR